MRNIIRVFLVTVAVSLIVAFAGCKKEVPTPKSDKPAASSPSPVHKKPIDGC